MKSNVTFLPNSLFTLCLTHFGFLIPFSHNVLECGSDDCPLELLGPLGTLFGGLFFNTLLVLASVKHGPGHFTRISLEKMGFHGAAIQKFVDLYNKIRKFDKIWRKKNSKKWSFRNLTKNFYVDLPCHLA